MSQIKCEITSIDELKKLIETKQIVAGKVSKLNDFGGTRLPFERIYPDGKRGPLIFQLPECFSFGLSENRAKDTNELTGYSMCAVLYDKNPTEEQLKFTQAINTVLYDFACDCVLQKKADIKKATLNKNTIPGALRNPIYWTYLETLDADENAIIDNEKPPKLYVKANIGWEPTKENELVKTCKKTFTVKSKKAGEKDTSIEKKMAILTEFWDYEGVDVDAFDLVAKHCTFKGAIVVEGLYCGPKITFQIKMTQCQVKIHEQNANINVLPRPTKNSNSNTTSNNVNESDGITITVKTDKKDDSADDLLE